jgi:hypothetical protein
VSEAIGLVAFATPVFALAVYETASPLPELLAAIATVVFATVLRWLGSDRWRLAPWIAVGADLLYVTANAHSSLVAGVLVGGAALGALLWLGYDTEGVGSLRDRAEALWLPFLSFSVALVISVALPAPDQLLGVAAGLLGAVFLTMAYLYRRPGLFIAPSPEGS